MLREDKKYRDSHLLCLYAVEYFLSFIFLIFMRIRCIFCISKYISKYGQRDLVTRISLRRRLQADIASRVKPRSHRARRVALTRVDIASRVLSQLTNSRQLITLCQALSRLTTHIRGDYDLIF